ncbi:MAG: hypothetical protein ACOY31_06640 [Bacillota bacterium]
MAKPKSAVRQEVPPVLTIEIVTERVKKDLGWVFVSVVVAVGAGLLLGQLVRL